MQLKSWAAASALCGGAGSQGNAAAIALPAREMQAGRDSSAWLPWDSNYLALKQLENESRKQESRND